MSGLALKLRDARPDAAGLLTSLAMRSKAYWGYPPEFMAACRGELTVTPADLGHRGARHVVAEPEARGAGSAAYAAGDLGFMPDRTVNGYAHRASVARRRVVSYSVTGGR